MIINHFKKKKKIKDKKIIMFKMYQSKSIIDKYLRNMDEI